jgi:prepilin-type N-terminal cleavage/methylation domain-containing protein
MSQRGFTLLELLVAAALGAVVLMAAGTLYVTATKYERTDESLTYMQRQGTLILEKMGRRIRNATGTEGIKCSPLATCA